MFHTLSLVGYCIHRQRG